MKKRYKIILSILLPIICITSVCMSFLFAGNKNNSKKTSDETPINKTRYQANYFATADEKSPAQGQSSSYKGGAVFLEPDSIFIMLGGTLENHTNTYGGAIFISEGATFTMNGGTITGCSAGHGGAIYVSAGGTCNINAGTITGNNANYGPSIYAEAGAIVNISEDTVIDENSVEIVKNISISTDTIAVGDPSAGFNLHYVDFGSYPQWYVGNDMNAILENWYATTSPEYISIYEIDSYYTNEDWPADKFYTYEYLDGNIYIRGIWYPYWWEGMSISTGEQLNNGDIVWFKVEPIRWIVLNYKEVVDGESDYIELMSYYVIEMKTFASSNNDTNIWRDSYLRGFLNSTFYDRAFTSTEKENIVKAIIANNIPDDYDSSTSNNKGDPTEDKIYCWSYWDFCNEEGLFENVDERRIATVTDYAKAVLISGTNGGWGYGAYWTRSAGTSALSTEGSTHACFVETDYGWLSAGGTLGMGDEVMGDNGVRPVLRLGL